MPKELTYQVECGPEDELFTFVYDFYPYDKGDRDTPPEGGMAEVTEIRHADGSVLPVDSWAAAGIDKKALLRIEEDIYQYHCEKEADAYDAAMEARGDAIRERDTE